MQRRTLLGGAAALALAAGLPGGAPAETMLNVMTAGSENMVDYVTDYLGPKFEETHPGVKVQVIGTGPGDAGSQKIYEKLEAQKAAGTEAWRRRRRGGPSEDGGPDGRGGPARQVSGRHRRPASW